MIDARHQGQGIGRAALRPVIEHVRSRKRFARWSSPTCPDPAAPSPSTSASAFATPAGSTAAEVVLELPLDEPAT